MHQNYQSDYANQLHQLAVSVSKHLSVTKTGRLRFQQKAMDVKLANLAKSAKEHVVHYLIRDHYSGVFYAEVHASSALIPIQQFLFRAWSQKNNYPFCGAPDFISIPKTVSDAYPGVLDLMRKCNVQTLEVTSGFQSGTIGDIKNWENLVRQYVAMEGKCELLRTWTPEVTCRVSAWLNGKRAEHASKIQVWADSVRELRVPA